MTSKLIVIKFKDVPIGISFYANTHGKMYAWFKINCNTGETIDKEEPVIKIFDKNEIVKIEITDK